MTRPARIFYTAMALLLPVFLVLSACFGFYRSHEADLARSAQRTIDGLTASSVECKAWIDWSAQQPGYADPEKFLMYWNAAKH